MPAGLFGITDETVDLVVNLIVLFGVVVWFALIAWTYFDARRRIDDPVLVAFATMAAIFPYVGTMVYAILRPPEFLDERRERELEIRAAQLRVRQLEEQACPNCEHPLEPKFLRCPRCRARIKNPCPSCAEPIDPRWSLCPYCETALRRAAPAKRRAAPASQRQSEPRASRTAAPAAASEDGSDEAKPARKTRAKANDRKQPAQKQSTRRSSSRQRS